MERSSHTQVQSVGRFEVFELAYSGREFENSFVEGRIFGTFTNEQETKYVEGFYDGKGRYIIRFMPSFLGVYEYRIEGNFSDTFDEGTFDVVPQKKDQHGPVKVANQYHFSYSDGVPYYQIGTTCYAWVFQSEELQRQTLKSLEEAPFNKIRFCLFPKHYDFNLKEPELYPFEGTPCNTDGISSSNFQTFLPNNPENHWDFTRPNPEYFRKIEQKISELNKLGIQADLILFHPYDRWGFSVMTPEQDAFYLKYVIARFSAYANVWWSLANEYDLCTKSTQEWEAIAETIVINDPYQRLRSIHNCRYLYDFSRPWITHCSIQRNEIYLSAVNTKHWREQYKKPVVLDEVGYEGNISFNWGNLTAEEMVRLFWTATVRGGYCGHGETYISDDQLLWWSHGTQLKGESHDRIAFLKRILEEVPGHGLEPANIMRWDDNVATAADKKYHNKYFLFYTGYGRPAYRDFYLCEDARYNVEVIDTWNMSIEQRGIYSGSFRIELPSRQYMALRIRMIE